MQNSLNLIDGSLCWSAFVIITKNKFWLLLIWPLLSFQGSSFLRTQDNRQAFAKARSNRDSGNSPSFQSGVRADCLVKETVTPAWANVSLRLQGTPGADRSGVTSGTVLAGVLTLPCPTIWKSDTETGVSVLGQAHGLALSVPQADRHFTFESKMC